MCSILCENSGGDGHFKLMPVAANKLDHIDQPSPEVGGRLSLVQNGCAIYVFIYASKYFDDNI